MPAPAGWSPLLAALLAVWQAARADGVGVRAAEAAHELRGSLCAARLALSSLQRRFPDATPLDRGVAAVDLELGRAGLALDQLSGAAGGRRDRLIRARQFAPRLVDLAALARAAEPAWQALARAHATRLELRTEEGPVMIAGDYRQLLQGVENLVANACEHGRGKVRVSVFASECGGARVEVSDEGGGPSPTAIRRARRRAGGGMPSRTDASSPHGHGMAIAARLARDSGGRLQARRQPSGAVVSLELRSRRGRGPSSATVSDGLRRMGRRVLARAEDERIETGLPEPLAGTR